MSGAAAEALLARLTALVEPVVLDFGYELVELQYRREAAGWVLRLIIDADQGVTIDDCAAISREVSHLLEVEDPIEGAYRLEVSSPGLDRPLKKEKDFIRCRGKKAKIKTREPVEGLRHFVGVIDKVADGCVFVATDHGVVGVPLDLIAKSRLVVEL